MPDDDAAAPQPALPDRVLLPALELAVGVAAAGAKLRPPLAFPPGLRPYLRFHRLPPAALARVRQAVEADPEFRGRLGEVATDDLVDEVGRLWLARPEGWYERAVALVEGHGAGDDTGGGLRREQRRREAAESAATRLRVELVTMRAELESERAGRAKAEADATQALAELTSVRAQLVEARRALEKRGSQLAAGDAGVSALQAEIAAVRAELAAAVEARDAALADRAAAHVGGHADVERVRALLVEALAATRPAEPRARRRVRKPIAIPGGVYHDSAAAAEHLLRTADVVVLVDGYNVAKLGWPALTLEEQRARCIDATENVARRWGTLLHVVFDGAAVVGAAATGRRLVRVSFSPEGITADDVLRAEVAALDADRPVVVVTNDQAVRADVRAAGANLVASDVFLTLALR